MSSNIWTRDALLSNAVAIETTAWRVVEAQHCVSTMKLVDPLARRHKAVCKSFISSHALLVWIAGTENVPQNICKPSRDLPIAIASILAENNPTSGGQWEVLLRQQPTCEWISNRTKRNVAGGVWNPPLEIHSASD
jgi:hypothetical protein